MSRRILTAIVALGLVLGACSLSGDDAGAEFSEIAQTLEATTSETLSGGDFAATETTAAAAEPTATTAAASEGAEEQRTTEPSEQEVGNGGVDGVLAAPTDLGRDIIFTAEITMAVDDVGEAGQAAGRAIQRFGGFLFGQETTGGAKPRTVLVFKVFPEDFQAVLTELGSIGEVRNQTVSADDVTERVVDLRSRISTAQASVERLRGFLENADDLETIATLENQLLQRETDLETLRGQLRTVESQVALATIVVTLTEARIAPAVAVQTTFYAGHGDGGFVCPGSPAISVETGEAVTACFQITNAGDTPLVDVTLNDTELGVSLADLTAVSGDVSVALAPEESLVFSFEFSAEENLRTRTTVTARPADPAGAALDEQPVADTVSSRIEVEEPDGITGFSDGLSESWEVLVSIVRLAVLAVAWMLPFSWIILIAAVAASRRRRRAPTPPAEPERAEQEPELV